MTGMNPNSQDRRTASPGETVDALVGAARRRGGVPLRNGFVQRGSQSKPEAGPLATLVSNSDATALDLYLLLLLVAVTEPFDSARAAEVWARALRERIPNATPQLVSRAWARLERHDLVVRSRKERRARIQLRREDGTGEDYTHPSSDAAPRYFKIPTIYWTSDERWHATLKLPAKAMLLVALSMRDGFVMPAERAPTWYGMSADTAQRGLAELQKRDAIEYYNEWKTAPLAPHGFTVDRHYRLIGDFERGPKS